MRKIKKINLTETSYNIFENIVSSKKWDNKLILDWILWDIEVLYKDFENNIYELFPMIPKWYTWNIKDALINCYESDTSLTKNYKQQIKALENRKCPYCYLEYSSQVEHYLPKEEFPEFAFMIYNLFPCCWTCNIKKWVKWRDATSRIILNFYYDLIPNEQFLYVKLEIIDNVPIANFKIDTSNIKIDKNIESILSKHIDRLNLLNRYAESINDKLAEFKNLVLSLKENLGDIDVKIICKSQADAKRKTYWNNYFVTVLYDEISNNDDILEFLFNI